VLNAKYTSSNQVTSHPYRSGLHVAKNWNKKQLVFCMQAENIVYSPLDHVIVQSHTWLPTFSCNSVCMDHIITEETDTVLCSQNMNRMTSLHHVTETSHSLPEEIKKASLWGYTIISITAPLMDTYNPVTLPPLAHYSNYLHCTSPVQYHFHKQLPLFALPTR
jgi:hypothetical protein